MFNIKTELQRVPKQPRKVRNKQTAFAKKVCVWVFDHQSIILKMIFIGRNSYIELIIKKTLGSNNKDEE